MLFNLIVWALICGFCFYMYRKLNAKIGDSPTSNLTVEEKLNADVNSNTVKNIKE